MSRSRANFPTISHLAVVARSLVLCLLAAALGPGCRHDPDIEFAGEAKAPTVQLIEPKTRTMVRVVGQPSFIETYERTSIYPKPTSYILKWNVDIGDRVKKVDVLATLFAPELVEELESKKALVVLDRERIALAKEVVEVNKADVKAAEAQLGETEAVLGKFESEVVRWDTEVKRLERQVAQVVVDRRVLFESNNQLKSSIAARDKAKASIKRAKADVLAARARLGKAEVDVRVAQAALTVAENDEQYAQAWVDYLTLKAPFPGVISARNANTFDIVSPTMGDPTAFYLSPDISPGGAAAPIYVVDRLDVVRIFVDIPERDANYVKIGTKATVLARAFRDTELPAKVTRTSWALNMKSRTLRAEIDLPNPGSQLLPGMYAYVNIVIERPNVQSLPVEAIEYSGDQVFCWLYEGGKAVRTEVDTGISDEHWIEVTNHRRPVSPEAPSDSIPWTQFDGSERVILGELSALRDGAPVVVAERIAETKAAGEPPGAAGTELQATPKGPASKRENPK
jgi:HlyD family secretion protein